MSTIEFTNKPPHELTSTDLIEKNSWLLSSVKSDLLEHKWSNEIISLYGWDEKEQVYRGESISSFLQHGAEADKVIREWSAQELEHALASGWWTVISGLQANRVVTMSNGAKAIVHEHKMQMIWVSMIAAKLPEGYEYFTQPVPGYTFLTNEKLNPSHKTSLGFYKKITNSEKKEVWRTWVLSKIPDNERNYIYEDLKTENHARAHIHQQLNSIDQEQDHWIFFPDQIPELELDDDTNSSDN